MKYLKIQNNGLLDVRLIALMGGTTKKDDAFKIGQFGTGLKYVLAYVLRNNIDFKIFVGEREVKLYTESENISNTDFEILFIDGQKTSITTNMGHDWKAWMILREIWCNALDEGHAINEITSETTGSINSTTFYIQLTSEIKEVYDKWEHYFVHHITPIFENDLYKIYPQGGTLKLYKQGVLIYENTQTESVFNYDFKNADINELREYKGLIDYDVYSALKHADKKTVEYFITHVDDKDMEADINWETYYGNVQEGWKQAIGEAKLITQKAINDITARGIDIDTTGMIIVPEKVFKGLTRQIEGVSALRVASKQQSFFEIHDAELEMRNKQAQAILESCGYFIDPELKILYGVFGDKTTLAQVNLDTKEIMISEQMRDKSLFCFIGMLIEENEHYRTGLQDCSRPFQQHWIDLFVKTLLDKNGIKL